MQIGGVIMDTWLVVLIILGLIAFVAVTVIWGIKAHRLKVEAGSEELVGRTAEVKTALSPKGTVFLEGEIWAAISDSGNIEAGQEVVISKVNGLILHVKKG